jgi:DNA-binding winged helix-turn-helix (wHTH) protein
MDMPNQLATVYPDKVKFGEKSVSVGPKAYRVARLVLKSNGCVRVADLAHLVWGELRVPRTRLAELICRLNKKLAKVDCPCRFSRDGGRVILI